MPVYVNGKELGGGGSGATQLDDLSDVSISGLVPGHILQWNGIVFENVAPSSTLGNSISVSSSTLLASDDTFVNCETDISGGNIVIDMPASVTAGEFHWVKDSGLNSDINTVIIDGNGNLIDGQSQITIQNPGGEVRITGHTNANKWTIG